MNSPISQLEQELWGCCVHQRAAGNKEMAERWQNDPFAYQQEGFVIERLPPSMLPLVEQAITEWKRIEGKVCSNLQMSREQFLEEFEKAWSNFQSGGNEWNTFARYGSIVDGAVRNMDIVNLFAWILPAADPDRREEHRAIGRMVAAVFHTELLYKGASQADPNDATFRRLEARWRLVDPTG